ncbi:hypothetical protein ON010_g14794 [Phytophthora cinnamomi]|nr:hypothetical protein ON010_g14794 [Phytophthora cinnamomi]
MRHGPYPDGALFEFSICCHVEVVLLLLMRADSLLRAAVIASVVCSVTSAEASGIFDKVKNLFHRHNSSAASDSTSGSAVDDSTCVYDWASLSCKPEASCAIQYHFGDVTPSEACRCGLASSENDLAPVKDATIETKSYYKDEDYSLYSYHAIVTSLKPNTKYFFKVGSATSKKFRSAVSSFTTARKSGDDSPFTVAVYGDMGADANAVETNKYVNGLVDKVDFVYHLGDVSYADDAFLSAKTAFGFYYEQVYNKFMNSMTNIMRRMAYMVLVGNHEAECHSPSCLLSDSKLDQLGNYSAFNSRFRMPSNESGGVLNMWYSYEYASVHFTTVSSETDYPHAPSNAYHTHHVYGHFGDQLAWLEEDLKAADANRDNVPWLVVGMHRPMYTIRSCDADGKPNNDFEALNVQEAFEALLIKYKVDLVLQGHVHAYERQYPVANGSAVMHGVSKDATTYKNPQAPVYVISGSAGGPEGLYKYKHPESPKWHAVMDNKHYSVTLLSVSPTNLTLTTVESATGAVIDKFSVLKDDQGSTNQGK